MVSTAEINEVWYSPKVDRVTAEFLVAFKHYTLHFEACRQPIPDADLAMACRIFTNAAALLKAKGQSL